MTDVIAELLEERDALRAELAALKAPGMVLVPVEPTPEMMRAAVVYANGNAVYKNVAAEVLAIEESIYGEVWAAMLQAAPTAPAAQAEPAHVTFKHKDGDNTVRFRALATSQLPSWAADVRPELAAQAEPACTWTQDDDGSDTWWAACGNGFTFTDGGPANNDMKHCCYCGKTLVEAPWAEPEADDEAGEVTK